MVIGAGFRIVAGFFGKTGTGGKVNLAADDRPEPGGAALEVELQGAEHVAMVGNRQRRHPVLFGFSDQIVKTDRPVKKRVLGMEMKMVKLRRLHDPHILMGAAGE